MSSLEKPSPYLFRCRFSNIQTKLHNLTWNYFDKSACTEFFHLEEQKFTEIEKMAGDSGEGAKLTGLSKYFNGVTNSGRANVAKATYAVIGLIIAYNVVKPKKK